MIATNFKRFQTFSKTPKSLKQLTNRTFNLISLQKMKNLVTLFVTLALLICHSFGHVIPEAFSSEETDNILSSPSEQQTPTAVKKEWIKVSKKPPTRLHYRDGQSLELECEIIGSPAPIVEWVRGTGQRIDVSFSKLNLCRRLSYLINFFFNFSFIRKTILSQTALVMQPVLAWQELSPA